MMQRTLHLLNVLSLVLVAGCATNSHDDPFHEWRPANNLVDKSGNRNPSEPNAAQPGDETDIIPDNAGPDDYVNIAILRNPGIKAAEQKVARLRTRVVQNSSLADPMFVVSPIGEMAQTAAGEVTFMAGLSQKLPTPGKLQIKGELAALEADQAGEELARLRLQIVADTRRAFWNYYFTARAIDVLEQEKDLLVSFQQNAEAKYKSGTTSQQDVLRASVEISNLENELMLQRQRQKTWTAMLNRLLDRHHHATLPIPSVIDPDHIQLDINHLLVDAAANNPDIKKIHSRIESFRKKLKLAELEHWPDLTVGLNYNAVDDDGLAMSANGDDQWWLSFGFNLPIWMNKLDSGKQEARHGIMENLAVLQNEHNRISFSVQDAFYKVETQQQQVSLFRDVIIPQARQAVEVSASGYRSGQVNFLTLIDNWRKLLDFKLLYHKNVTTLEQHFAELQQAVGMNLPRNAQQDKS